MRALQQAIAAAPKADPRVVASGAYGSSTHLLSGALAIALHRPILLLTAHLDDADDAAGDLELFTAAGHALHVQRFGALEVLPGESNVSLDLLAERIDVVQAFSDGSYPAGASVLIAPIQAMMQSIPTTEALGDLTLTLRTGDDLPLNRLIEWLATAGYQRVDGIEQPGDFAVRGGIVDVFPPVTRDDAITAGAGVRLDYFGDEIDTISLVDPDTMGSGARLKEVKLLGARPETLQRDESTTALWTLLPEHTLVVLSEVMELAEQARGYFERLSNPVGIYPPQAVFKAMTARPHVEVNQYSSTAAKSQTVALPVHPLVTFAQEASEAIEELATLAASGEFDDVVVLSPTPAEQERLSELITEHDTLHDRDASPIRLEVGFLHRGFVWRQPPNNSAADDKADIDIGGSLLIPHQELFHRYDTRRRIRRIGAERAGARPSDAFLDLDVGDHVVHIDHGIARFTGLRTMRREGKSEEFLTLEFAGKALLHVPATQIDLVQKYVGGHQGKPPLSTLGGKRWGKQREAATEAAKQLAAELLRVQAARSSLPGIRYPADTSWQKEFDASFPFDETEDQLAAIAATKKDMHDEQPMDRLICGDVGFGKTEVAMRAAFKAAEFGKQVAVLVPTTVLAEQHERTFKSRMADYPFRVESVSRFKTAKAAKDVLHRTSRGEVDILIGTHRLLSKDVTFADLGLVIIDEEQRFGVEHKNRLLELRMTADVMTLSATPIPRTLHMSMLGLRDISSLTTAPMDRRAIVTEVISYDEHRIKNAIVRELNREGQVYFVHNRVHDILTVAAEIKSLVPDARIVVGHGQMATGELEKVMLKFIRREADILVSTTIIESGLDIATANTMLINNANHFGLSELHQLRGRVGRYKHRAYCYLMIPAEMPVTDKAAQRLRAIEQFAMLGAGFKIAMRDLEIRGAGNLLGAEQSGHIASVGYEMYCKLLEQETRKLKHGRFIEPVKTHIELPAVAGRIPKEYIHSDKFRMDAYRRLSRALTLEELDGVSQDMTDAYGKPPDPVQMLIDLTELRIALSMIEVKALKLDGPDLIFRTDHPKQLEPMLASAPGRASVIDPHTVYYRPPANYLEPVGTLLAVLRKLIVRPVRTQQSPAASS